MGKSENEFVAWLAGRYPPVGDDGVVRGIGDDMAVLPRSDAGMLVTTDMLMDGVHFDTATHSDEQIGRKALAVNLSDCAAMAVRPRYAVVSVALPNEWTMNQARGLYLGMDALSERYGCRIVGGDTNSWDRPLVISLTVIAEPWPGVRPVGRTAMRAGDVVCVTGRLGGSLASGRHLSFEPRVHEARTLAETLGDRLHAMMDLSDGLSTDAERMAKASGCGIEFNAEALECMISNDARQAANVDGRSPLEHAMDDGEDFELLFAAAPEAVGGTANGGARCVGDQHAYAFADSQTRGDSQGADCGVEFTVIGLAIEAPGVRLRLADGQCQPLAPGGWQHFQ